MKALGMPPNRGQQQQGVTDDSVKLTLTVSDITAGLCDSSLRVPRLAAVVEQSHMSEGTWIIHLKDTTGRISGFMSAEAARTNPHLLCRGSSVLLQAVAIFVSEEVDYSQVQVHVEDGSTGSNTTRHDPDPTTGRSRFKRYLNIHKNCIVSVYPGPAMANTSSSTGTEDNPRDGPDDDEAAEEKDQTTALDTSGGDQPCVTIDTTRSKAAVSVISSLGPSTLNHDQNWGQEQEQEQPFSAAAWLPIQQPVIMPIPQPVFMPMQAPMGLEVPQPAAGGSMASVEVGKRKRSVD